MAIAPMPKRGEVWMVDFDPSDNRFVRLMGEITPDQIDDIASAIAMCVGAP